MQPWPSASRMLKNAFVPPSYVLLWADHSVAVFHADPQFAVPLLIGSLAAVRLALLLALRPRAAVQVDAVAVTVAPAALSPSPVHLWNEVYHLHLRHLVIDQFITHRRVKKFVSTG